MELIKGKRYIIQRIKIVYKKIQTVGLQKGK